MNVMFSRNIILLGLLLSLFSLQTLAQGEAEDITVPQKAEWVESVNMADVPDIPVRPVGSGICENPKCDGEDNDRCFESCGNKATVSDIYGCPRDHHWALTFDDGPSNYTSSLLDILDKYNIKATFCVMGAHVEKYPEVVKRAYEAGHHIASHTYSHPHLMSLTNEEIINEVKATEEAIINAIGVKPRYLRPPFGEADSRVKALLRAMGYKVLMWNVDPTDYDVYMKSDGSKRIQNAFVKAAKGVDTGLNAHEDPGFISLQHDLYKKSIDQVPKVIEFLKKRGFTFMTAAECLDDHEPYDNLKEAMVVQDIKQAGADNTTLSASSSGSSSTTASESPIVSSSPTKRVKAAKPKKHGNNASGASTLTMPLAALAASFVWAGFMMM